MSGSFSDRDCLPVLSLQFPNLETQPFCSLLFCLLLPLHLRCPSAKHLWLDILAYLAAITRVLLFVYIYFFIGDNMNKMQKMFSSKSYFSCKHLIHFAFLLSNFCCNFLPDWCIYYSLQQFIMLSLSTSYPMPMFSNYLTSLPAVKCYLYIDTIYPHRSVMFFSRWFIALLTIVQKSQ